MCLKQKSGTKHFPKFHLNLSLLKKKRKILIESFTTFFLKVNGIEALTRWARGTSWLAFVVLLLALAGDGTFRLCEASPSWPAPQISYLGGP